jgi:hypothetical protein
MKMGSGGIAPPFLTSEIDGGEWSVSHPGYFTLREKAPGTHCIEGWVDPRADLGALEKRKISCPCWELNTDFLAISL